MVETLLQTFKAPKNCIEDSKVLILGKPAPACMPSLIQKMKQSDGERKV
jgi:hypothetical protein